MNDDKLDKIDEKLSRIETHVTSKNTKTAKLGCVNAVIIILIGWLFIFGIAIDGEHRDVSCSCKGVTVEK